MPEIRNRTLCRVLAIVVAAGLAAPTIHLACDSLFGHDDVAPESGVYVEADCPLCSAVATLVSVEAEQSTPVVSHIECGLIESVSGRLSSPAISRPAARAPPVS